jgi:hypothetical protein
MGYNKYYEYDIGLSTNGAPMGPQKSGEHV